MSYNCCSNRGFPVNTVSNCQTCEPNAANIRLDQCAGYGFVNNCNCACPPSGNIGNFGLGCNCGTPQNIAAGCNCGSTPSRACLRAAERAANCVVDCISDFLLQQTEKAEDRFTRGCVREALGLNDHNCECDCDCGCGSGRGSERGLSRSCERFVAQNTQAVADCFVCDVQCAIENIAAQYENNCNNLLLADTGCGTTQGINHAGCGCGCGGDCGCGGNRGRRGNAGCGCNCPTVGNGRNQTTWGRCY